MPNTANKPRPRKAHVKANARAGTISRPKASAKPAPKRAATSGAAVEKPKWTPPSGSGTMCWHELMTSDASGAKAFYSALFGWACKDMPLGDSGIVQGIIERGGDGIACLSPVGNPATASHWLTYVQVDDVDASAAKIASLGGQVTTRPVDIPGGHGRYAIAKDPQGATFAVYAMPKA